MSSLRFVEKEAFGKRFGVVDPESMGLVRGQTTSAPVHEALKTFDDHEPPWHEHWSQIQPGDLVVDAGACFGSYTLPALALGAFVVAYEPMADACRMLQASVDVNGWTSRCMIRRAALWDLKREPYPKVLYDSVFTEHYPAEGFEIVSLDEDLNMRHGFHQLRPLRWLKSDVEGAELGLLWSAERTLERDHPRLIIEDHENALPGVGCAVSDYPASIQSRKQIVALLELLSYEVEVVNFERNRHYIIGTKTQALAPCCD